MDFKPWLSGAVLAGCGEVSAPPGPVPEPGIEPAACPVAHTAGLDGRCMAVGIQGCVDRFIGEDSGETTSPVCSFLERRSALLRAGRW